MLTQERHVQDDFGRPAEASSTYLRYQIEVGYETPTYRGTLGRLVLLSEVSVGLRDQPGFVVGKHSFAWVNRYDVDRVRSELELPFYFPGAEREAPVPPVVAPSIPTSVTAKG